MGNVLIVTEQLDDTYPKASFFNVLFQLLYTLFVFWKAKTKTAMQKVTRGFELKLHLKIKRFKAKLIPITSGKVSTMSAQRRLFKCEINYWLATNNT